MTVLWVAQAVTVTNGDNEVIVTSAPGNAITKVETSATFHGVGFSLPYEIERTYNNGTNDVIVLYENWAGSSGSIAAVAVPSGAAVTRAADSLEALRTVYEALADSVSTTAVANGIPKYSSQGRLKAAAGSASDDVMIKSQFSPGAFGPDCSEYGFAGQSVPLSSTIDVTSPSFFNYTQAAWWGPSASPKPFDSEASDYGALINLSYSTSGRIQIGMDHLGQILARYNNQDVVKIHHSGNANFHEFGGISANDEVAQGVVQAATVAKLVFNLNSPTAPVDITVDGTFSLYNFSHGTVIASGLGDGDFVLNSRTTNKKGIIFPNGLTGMNAGEEVHLVAESSTSKITFNF